jgi:hypothetical protein
VSTDTFDVSIATPGNWIPLEAFLPEGADADALVGERLAEVPELAPHREHLVETVESTMARARGEGMLFCAVLADLTDKGEPVIANLAVATVAAPPAGDDGRVDPVSLAEIEEGAANADEADVSQRHVDSILLPGGPAIRIARLVELELAEGGPSLTTLSVQYFLTVPDQDQFVILSFTTPTVAEHLELQAVFHEIALTFRFAQPR